MTADNRPGGHKERVQRKGNLAEMNHTGRIAGWGGKRKDGGNT